MARMVLQTQTVKEDGQWYCVAIFADAEGPKTQVGQTLRVGPWPSRQVARSELRGKFRECVLEALRDFVAKGNAIDSISYDGHEMPLTLLDDPPATGGAPRAG